MPTNHTPQSKQESNAQQKPPPTLSPQPATEIQNPATALQRVQEAPRPTIQPTDILALQRTVGNQAVQRLLQRKPLEKSGQGEAGIVQRMGLQEATSAQSETRIVWAWRAEHGQHEQAQITDVGDVEEMVATVSFLRNPGTRRLPLEQIHGSRPSQPSPELELSLGNQHLPNLSHSGPVSSSSRTVMDMGGSRTSRMEELSPEVLEYVLAFQQEDESQWKKLYRRLALNLHPDKTHGDDTSFKAMQIAFDFLNGPKEEQSSTLGLLNHNEDSSLSEVVIHPPSDSRMDSISLGGSMGGQDRPPSLPSSSNRLDDSSLREIVIDNPSDNRRDSISLGGNSGNLGMPPLSIPRPLGRGNQEEDLGNDLGPVMPPVLGNLPQQDGRGQKDKSALWGYIGEWSNTFGPLSKWLVGMELMTQELADGWGGGVLGMLGGTGVAISGVMGPMSKPEPPSKVNKIHMLLDFFSGLAGAIAGAWQSLASWYEAAKDHWIWAGVSWLGKISSTLMALGDLVAIFEQAASLLKEAKESQDPSPYMTMAKGLFKRIDIYGRLLRTVGLGIATIMGPGPVLSVGNSLITIAGLFLFGKASYERGKANTEPSQEAQEERGRDRSGVWGYIGEWANTFGPLAKWLVGLEAFTKDTAQGLGGGILSMIGGIGVAVTGVAGPMSKSKPPSNMGKFHMLLDYLSGSSGFIAGLYQTIASQLSDKGIAEGLGGIGGWFGKASMVTMAMGDLVAIWEQATNLLKAANEAHDPHPYMAMIKGLFKRIDVYGRLLRTVGLGIATFSGQSTVLAVGDALISIAGLILFGKAAYARGKASEEQREEAPRDPQDMV